LKQDFSSTTELAFSESHLGKSKCGDAFISLHTGEQRETCNESHEPELPQRMIGQRLSADGAKPPSVHIGVNVK
jgi:hypothetical protein